VRKTRLDRRVGGGKAAQVQKPLAGDVDALLADVVRGPAPRLQDRDEDESRVAAVDPAPELAPRRQLSRRKNLLVGAL
jgi:hypothetical protein